MMTVNAVFILRVTTNIARPWRLLLSLSVYFVIRVPAHRVKKDRDRDQRNMGTLI